MSRIRRTFIALCLLLIAVVAAPSAAQKDDGGDDYDVNLSGSPLFRTSEHFRVHYTLTGDDAVPDENYVDEVIEALELSWQVQIVEMGWAAPPSDDGRGGDDLYDVYLQDLTDDEALGITYPQDVIGDNPNSPAREDWAATSYLAVENDFNDVAFDPNQDILTLMRATVAHEFNHAVQFGYDIADAHNWIYEATATWMETKTAGEDQDATGYVGDAYSNPAMCFGSVAEEGDSSIHYADWMFIDHVAQDYGDEFIRTVWEFAADEEGFDVWEDVLETKDTDIGDTFAAYHLRNLARDYELADLFTSSVRITDTINDAGVWVYERGVQELGVNYFALDLQPGLYRAALQNDRGEDLTLWAYGIVGTEVETYHLDRDGYINPSAYDDFYLMVLNPTYDDDLGECDSIGYELQLQPEQRRQDSGGALSRAADQFRTFDGTHMRHRVRPLGDKDPVDLGSG